MWRKIFNSSLFCRFTLFFFRNIFSNIKSWAKNLRSSHASFSGNRNTCPKTSVNVTVKTNMVWTDNIMINNCPNIFSHTRKYCTNYTLICPTTRMVYTLMVIKFLKMHYKDEVHAPIHNLETVAHKYIMWCNIIFPES